MAARFFSIFVRHHPLHTELSQPTALLKKETTGIFGFPFAWQALPFLCLWGMACWGLSGHWTTNPQYQYGWFVPGLALVTAMGRWQTRPVPGEPVRGALWVILGLAALLPAVWVFLQPNPDWPLANWFFVLQVVAITLAAIGLLGGKPWIAHFFWPAAMILTAIPWPDQWEGPLMQFLMRTAAALGVGVLDLLGVAAIQHGNLIEVASGVVGVDEACSGIRSLQGSMMAAIFLGEFFRFNGWRRLTLVLAGIALAFATNVIRVCILAWGAAASGIDTVSRWHDPAGFTILAVCVGAILCTALFLDRKSRPLTVLAVVPNPHSLSSWLVPSLALWIAATAVGTALWYYDGGPTPEPNWSLVSPARSQPVTVSSNARAQLRYDTGQGATWTQPDGTRWLLYYFDWNYGPAFARVAAQLHNPAICLPASGRELKEQRGELPFTVDGTPLPFRGYTFTENGQPLFVYHGIWQFRSARGMQNGPISHSKQIASLQSVMWRESRIGQQAVEVAIWGCATAEEADAAFAKALPSFVHSRQSHPTAQL